MSKNLASYETLLQKNPLFQGIPQAKLPCVLEKLKAHTRYYKKEETIRHCGSAVNFIGIVLEGDIHILQDDYTAIGVLLLPFPPVLFLLRLLPVQTSQSFLPRSSPPQTAIS